MTALEPQHRPAESAASALRADRSALARRGLDWHDAFALALVLLFPLAFFPGFELDFWTARMMLLTLALPYGVACLAGLVCRGDRAALFGVALVIWATVGALASAAPWQSMVGSLGRSESVVLLAGYLALWAIARRLSRPGRQAAVPVLLVSGSIAAFIGLAQVLAQIDTGSLAMVSGRASGLSSNPVYFSGLCSALIAVAAHRAVRSPHWWRWGLLVFAYSLVLGLSGSRAGVLSVIAVLLAIAVAAPRTRLLAVPPLAFVAGIIASYVVQSAIGSGDVAAGRLSSSSGGGRLDVWGFGLSAVRERPVLGWGIGRFRPAIQEHFSSDFVRVAARDDVMFSWFDAHNLIVQIVVGLGVVGLVLAVSFLVFAVRAAHGPLLFGAAATCGTFLLQPTNIHLAPIAMLLLGAALPRSEGLAAADSAERRPRRGWHVGLVGVAAVVGLGWASLVGVMDLQWAASSATATIDDDLAVSRRFGFDVTIANAVSNAADETYANGSVGDAELLEAAERPTELEPDFPHWWNQLANRRWRLGDDVGMKAAIDRALELQPTNPRSWTLMLLYAQAIGDDELESDALAMACSLAAPSCSEADSGN